MSIIVVFAILFVIISFIILPIGIQVATKPEPGHATSAPNNPRIQLKIVIITCISLILTGIFYYLIYKFPQLEYLLKEEA